MDKNEVEILNNIESVDENSKILAQPPNTPQQTFMLTYAAIHFLSKGCHLSILNQLLQHKYGTFSELVLRLKYMKECLETKVNLEDKSLHVLGTLVLWMEKLQKLPKSNSINLVSSVLLPNPSQLKFDHYEQFFVYLNYLAGDIQSLFKLKSGNSQWDSDDLILFLQLSIPRVHYNIILPQQPSLKDSEQSVSKQILFLNQSLEYFTRTKNNYRGLSKLVLQTLMQFNLKTNQTRQLLDIACKYYMLFWVDPKQTATELFLMAFEKTSEAVRFSMTDQLLLFFKVCQKMGANQLQILLRQKSSWLNSLLCKYSISRVGYPKDEVVPFCPLKIKDNLVVQAGKRGERFIEIYRDYSLLYFRAIIEDNDIDLKLYYLGDFQRKTQVKVLIHIDSRKSGQARFAFLANKKGIYMVQFDNSYSWVNNKTLSFDYVVLSPLLRSTSSPTWLSNLFQTHSAIIKNIDTELVTPNLSSKEDIIQTRNLQSIYSSERYQRDQLEEEEELSVSQQESSGEVSEKSAGYINQVVAQQKQKTKIQTAHKTEEEAVIQQVIDEQPMVISDTKSDPPQQETKGQKELPLQPSLIKQQRKPIRMEKVVSQEAIRSQESVGQLRGQANLSFIDQIFSLLVNTQEHTYEFQTNLQDRVIKRLKSYCESEQQLQWIVNSEARDWLRKQGFQLHLRKGISTLTISETGGKKQAINSLH